MSELLGDHRKKVEMMKEIIRRIHSGVAPAQLKEEFKQIVASASPLEIAQVEQELVEEGIPAEEIRQLCDVHIEVFKESLDKATISPPAGHPLEILMTEHHRILDKAADLYSVAESMRKKDGFDSAGAEIDKIAELLEFIKGEEKHFEREENVLFPYLEKHGVIQPPAIMWTEHDQIRRIKKNIHEIFENRNSHDFAEFVDKLSGFALGLVETVASHFYKENNILFPTGMDVITDEEWIEIRRQFDEIGYCCYEPPSFGESVEKKQGGGTPEGIIKFETGELTSEQIEAIFNTLPVDITFVDANDEVKFFNEKPDKIFVRVKAIIGRKVQNCHPQKSIDIVNKIVGEFKSGRRDHADFWINMGGRLIYIRYFAVRDKNGKYLGTIEVTQDITDIKKIEGERRLLDWE